MNVSRVALIPARGGSKRLPRKNVLDFSGRPIIAFTIMAAIDSKRFERVVVSTEDNEIADVAARFGAEIDQRPSGLAADEARVTDVCIDFLNREENAGRNWAVMACLYATAPMRNAEDIQTTVDLIEPGRCAFAMAVTRYALTPHQALKMGRDGGLAPMWPDLVERRASELPPLVVDNGSTYAVEVDSFRHYRSFYGPGLRGYAMPRNRSIDIDTREDYEFALWLAGRSGASER
jgi:CMP-N-acetylneuraminic acid synthetase